MFDTIINIIIFILSLCALVVMHELGHFITAKLFGVYCREFSVGMGPLICKFKKPTGETQFSIRAIPIGGFVSMVGEDAGDNDSMGGQQDPSKKEEEQLTEEDLKILALPAERRLDGIAKWKRLIIMAGGVVMNVILAFLLFVGQGATERIVDPSVNYVLAVEEGKLAEAGYIEESAFISGSYKFIFTDEAGVVHEKEGSSSINNASEVYEFICVLNDYENYMPYSNQDNVTFTFECIAPNENKEYLLENKYTISFTLNVAETNAFENIGGSTLYYDTSNIGIKYYGRNRTFKEVMSFATKSTGEGAILIYRGLASLFTDGLQNLGGPIAMFQMSSTAVSQGISTFLYLWGIISINLAVMNFLPIPGLDGWHFLVLIVEGITKKEFPKNAKNIASMIGLILIFGLMILITFKDIFMLIF